MNSLNFQSVTRKWLHSPLPQSDTMLLSGLAALWLVFFTHYENFLVLPDSLYNSVNSLSGLLAAGHSYLLGHTVYAPSGAGYPLPPHTLPLFALLSHFFSVQGLSFIWTFLAAVLNAGIFVALFRRKFQVRLAGILWALVLAVMFIPFRETFRAAQVDLFILPAALFYIYGYGHERRWVRLAAECLFGLMGSLRLFPYLLLLVPLFQKKFASVTRVLGVFVILLLLSLATQGNGIWLDYLGALRSTLGSTPGHLEYISPAAGILNIMQTTFLLQPDLDSFSWLENGCWLLAVLAYAGFVWEHRQNHTQSHRLLLLGTAGMILLSRQSWYPLLIYLAPSAVYFFATYWSKQQRVDYTILLPLMFIQWSPWTAAVGSLNTFAVVGALLLLARFTDPEFWE